MSPGRRPGGRCRRATRSRTIPARRSAAPRRIRSLATSVIAGDDGGPFFILVTLLGGKAPLFHAVQSGTFATRGSFGEGHEVHFSTAIFQDPASGKFGQKWGTQFILFGGTKAP